MRADDNQHVLDVVKLSAGRVDSSTDGLGVTLFKLCLMFKIIINEFQMDINCIYVYDHNSCISKGHCIFMKYYFNV